MFYFMSIEIKVPIAIRNENTRCFLWSLIRKGRVLLCDWYKVYLPNLQYLPPEQHHGLLQFLYYHFFYQTEREAKQK